MHLVKKTIFLLTSAWGMCIQPEAKAQIPEAEIHNQNLADRARELEKELSSQSENVLLGLTLGHQYYLAGDYAKAEPFYLKALDEDLLMLKDQFQLIQILIENNNLPLAREINSLSQEIRPMMHRLSEQVILNASGKTPAKFLSNKLLGHACCPTEYMSQISYRTDGGIYTERVEQGQRMGSPLKIGGISGQDIRHGIFHPLSGQLWSTHNSKGRFTLTVLSQKSQGSYHKPAEFEWSDGKSHFAHAAFNSSGTVLIFASDMPGGSGGFDLYRSIWTDGKWSKPVNLGSEINSERNELFPFLDAENRLYFSSNGFPSMGGYDLYSVALDEEDLTLQHLPPPFNSIGNEYGITALSSTEWYISSDRDRVLSIWKLWQKSPAPLHPGFLFKGKLTDDAGNALNDALILWGSEEEGAFTRSDPSGNFEIRVRYQHAVPKSIEIFKSGFRDTVFELKSSQFSDKNSNIQSQVFTLHPSKNVTAPSIVSTPVRNSSPSKKEPEKPRETADFNPPKEEIKNNVPEPALNVEPQSYYAVLHSSKIQTVTEDFVNKYRPKFAELIVLPSASGHYRAVIPLGTDKSIASRKVISYRSFVKDCWLLRQ